ncbi:hypothetical protein BCU93_14365 [Vibrio breoganii]|uniref:diguanylate cyclase domain-containing protein n=2 Tax=Vibrio breoganii TaxID=553239 RepID=UPI000C84EEA9|nr:diguanylate cyclase [Vibrio breoganii]PMG38124.1 hypothetical protein BCU93_14365 [Vibrio breoganii]PMG97727.1 hypothetical protein BCU80_18380 [Vibrio breoganii]PML36912.1 hypothetical protein BCT77_16455 [Vibrio breoganii]PML63253.1 hypothetical protein BCT73_05385 [Vibrio breoganii]PMM81029.1 hypothetical protein BCT45_14365 [Vibrio breoganii]
MSLSKKILYILLPLLAAMVAVSYFAHWQYVFPVFKQLEREDAITNFERVAARFDEDIVDLDLQNKDWGAWDDTYEFIQGENPDYIDANLGVESFRNGQFDFLFFFDISQHLYWHGIYDSKTNALVYDGSFVQRVVDRLEDKLAQTELDLFSPDTHYTGFVLLENKPIVYSIRPILTSQETGPSMGFVLRGRYIDPSLISNFIKQTHVRFKITPVVDKAKTYNDEIVVTELDDETLEVSRYVFSYGVPVMLVESFFPRDISGQGRVAVQSALFTSILLGFLLLLALWVTLRKVVLEPVTHLTQKATAITETQDYKKRAQVETSDEIGELSRQLNKMLDVIESREASLEDVLAQLKEQSMTDALTQISNRLRFDSVSEMEWRRMQREKLPISIIMCDADYFKQYNDHYGHVEGDRCLINIAQVLNESVARPADLVARYGGEEFVILLPSTDLSGAAHLAQTVLDNISALQLPHAKSQVAPYVTVSLGIASVVPSEDNSLLQLITDADNALYQAKQNGRNTLATN